MRYSQFFINTRRGDPKDETSANARWLWRGGFVDKLMAGSYTFLPLGWRIYQKIEQITREEMNAVGGGEVLMPLLHPKDIWNETGRWSDVNVKQIMHQFKSADEKEYGLSFTHEEIFLDVVRKNTLSYKNLPVKLYHFSTKFRNEPRAKSGLLRGREFIMKDLYSLHATEKDLDDFYWQVKDAYLKVFNRIGLKNIKVVEASGGVFTSGHTHEFQLPHPVGEDNIYFCSSPAGECDWAQNKEIYTHKIGTACPSCGGNVEETSSIEVGNIFRFGTVYSEKMGVNFKDADGQDKPPYLGSYGIGMSRLVGVLAEVFNDEAGLVWPKNVAPFLVHLVSLGQAKDEAERLYKDLIKNSVDVLWDDRDESAGVKLADADLIGIPYRVVVSEKTLAQESVEAKQRDSKEVEMVKLDKIVEWIKNI
ncbi:MAG: aminoacyl--tRNA ligase-related protein [Patescibacteria group bacterium]